MYFYHSSNWRKQRTSVLFLIYLAAFIGIILFSLPGISAAQVTLSWDANTEPNLAGYKVYYGVSSGNYQLYKDVGKTTTTSISSLQSGSTYYFAITAYDHSGSESEYSNEVSYTPGPGCPYEISPAMQSFESSGGTGKVSVTTPTGCSWSVFSNASWLLLTSNSTQTGNSTVNFSVSSHTGSTSRSGTLTVAGKTFTVNQSGVECSYSISPASQSLGSGGGTGTVNVTTSTGCPWSASSPAASGTSWITITSGKTGTGNGTAGYSVSANSGSLIQDRNPDCCREDLHGESIRRGVQLFHLSRQPVPRLRRRDGHRQRDHLRRLPLECLQSRC